MLHPDREWTILDVTDRVALAACLCRRIWPLDTAFRAGSTLFLNDSISAQGPQTYAVVRDGLELDAIEFSACAFGEALDYLDGILDSATADYPGAGAAEHARLSFDGDRCRLAA